MIMSDDAYKDRGELEVTIICNEKDCQRLMDEIIDETRGGVIFLWKWYDILKDICKATWKATLIHATLSD